MSAAVAANDHPLARAFETFVRDQAFPCVGAKSALARSQMDIIVARDITSSWDDLRIHPGLFEAARRFTVDPSLFQSFVVVFEGPRDLDELAFERAMWDRIQSLADKDAFNGVPYDASVDPDPNSPHFSLSFGGEAFFAVGMHPGASRPARRFHTPAVVFNLHRQFEMLRAAGTYEKLRASILQRDVTLAGAVNPMLARHGESSEARQYSGRAVDESWSAPFDPQSGKCRHAQ
ncbi:MAG: guanitoxin biosynthesis heme-dependent pre-guanitoxin N-hydroxylase GntA [Pseudomonadota bacterium]|nr:guanitoxin biosynthesis heme-dependent pre-guanitoxin N-hydroxylase GntA [Pseudomonadota bacterium]